MANKPSIPKGTRDFGPVEMAKRNYIFNTIREVYGLYGFQQIETPAMETLQTLMGKYGEEGDKLLFKVLNSGDCLSKCSDEELLERNALHLASKMCEKGLRYDLTVPFARYVVMHREELQLPFKRYQIQPVWRADRPQKGRYREFYQCDADVVGSDSLLNEVELMQIVDTVFSRFGIRVQIKINNRKILSGIAEVIGAADKIVDITVAIDKLDKIGIDNVNGELREDGLSEEQIQKLQPIIMLTGTNDEKLATIADVLKDSETGLKGVEELRFILNVLKTEFVSSIDTVGTREGLKKTVLLTTSSTTKVVNTPAIITLDALRRKANIAEYNQHYKPVSVLVEGVFPSLFTGYEQVDKNIGFYEKSKPTKMLFVSDGDMVKNQTSDQKYPLPLGYDRFTDRAFGNQQFLLNAVNYLCDDEEILQVRSKDFKMRLLDNTRVLKEKTFWQVNNVTLPLVLILLLGLVMFVCRRWKYVK